MNSRKLSSLLADPTYRSSSPFSLGKLPPILLALYVGLSLMLTFVHGLNVNMRPQFDQQREARHREIINGRGEAPYGYRVLVPRIAEPIRRVLEDAGFHKTTARETAYLILRWTFTLAGLLLFHAFLAAWFDPAWSLAGTLLFAALHPATYHHYWYQPASALDLALWLSAALLAQRRVSGWWLLPIVMAGAFNRETIVFAPLVYLALAYGNLPLRRLVIPVGFSLGVWGCVFFGLRWGIVGPLPSVVSMSSIIRENWSHASWVAYAVVFFGVLWVLPVVGWRRVRPELKRLVLLMVPYLVLQILFGRIREVRLLLPMAMALIPVALDYFRAAMTESSVADRNTSIGFDIHDPE